MMATAAATATALFFFSVTLTVDAIECDYYSDGSQYFPADVCWNYDTYDQSARFSCYKNQLYLTRFYRLNCIGNSYYNQTDFYDENTARMNCSFNQICDFMEVSYYEDIISCNQIQFETSSSVKQIVTNQCVYAPSYGIYRLDSCTHSLWSISVYTTSDCTVSSLLYTLHVLYPICSVDDDSQLMQYQDITQCTQPLNTLQCGYIQLHQNQPLIPLNVCLLGKAYSYSYACYDGSPYLYVMDCDTSVVHRNLSVKPFSYWCSSTVCNYASVYSETDINHVVTEECFNYFDEDLKMISSQYACDGYLSKYVYNAPNCNENNTMATIHYNNSDTSCFTLSPTYSPSLFLTFISPNTNIDPSVMYITAYGLDSDGCGSEYNPCGSFAGILPKLNDTEMRSAHIIVRGQNFDQISSGNDCLFQILDRSFFEQSAMIQITVTQD